MQTLIVYNSITGYTKRYVDIIGEALGCDAVPLKKAKPRLMYGYDRVIYMGGVRDNTIVGYNKINKVVEYLYLKIVVVGVGMLPPNKDRAKRVKAATVPTTYEDFIPVFYLQGGFDYNKLSKSAQMVYRLALQQRQAIRGLGAEDEFLLSAMEAPIDFVSEANAAELIRFLNGEEVQESATYCSATKTAEDVETHFEEIKQAAVPKSKKERDLKKRLKG